jgi:hypothetical protein
MEARLTPRNRRLAFSALALLLLVRPASAQPPSPPTLDEILTRLESNLQHCETAVPTFFCDEHVLSRLNANPIPSETITDSTFRLKRTEHPDGTSTLDESRDVKKVNGLPASGEDLTGQPPSAAPSPEASPSSPSASKNA